MAGTGPAILLLFWGGGFFLRFFPLLVALFARPVGKSGLVGNPAASSKVTQGERSTANRLQDILQPADTCIAYGGCKSSNPLPTLACWLDGWAKPAILLLFAGEGLCLLPLCALSVLSTGYTDNSAESPKGGGSLHRLQEVLQPPDWVLADATPLSGLGDGVSTPHPLCCQFASRMARAGPSHPLLLWCGEICSPFPSVLLPACAGGYVVGHCHNGRVLEEWQPPLRLPHVPCSLGDRTLAVFQSSPWQARTGLEQPTTVFGGWLPAFGSRIP